jgi:hypothetical protein
MLRLWTDEYVIFRRVHINAGFLAKLSFNQTDLVQIHPQLFPDNTGTAHSIMEISGNNTQNTSTNTKQQVKRPIKATQKPASTSTTNAGGGGGGGSTTTATNNSKKDGTIHVLTTSNGSPYQSTYFSLCIDYLKGILTKVSFLFDYFFQIIK